jgi:2-dehydro-3-deoxygluconokinase
LKKTKNIALLGECMLELSGAAFGTVQQSYGGDTFNTAVYLSRCGGPDLRVSYATAVGDDALSEDLLAHWKQDGIALDLVRQIPGRMPGIYQIAVDAQGERSFSFWRNDSAARSYFDIDMTPLEAQADQWDAFYFSGISLAILPPAARQRVLQFAASLREAGKRVVFDNNYRPRLWESVETARTLFSSAFAVADTVLITADDHQALFALADLQASVDAAYALAAPEVVVKRGAAPTLVRLGHAPWTEVAAERVATVVDSTAAGDSFAAGYLCQRLAGAAPAQAAAFGNRLAARVIQHRGAIIGLAAMQDLIALPSEATP